MHLVLILTIFNEGAYMTFKSIFHKALNLFYFDCDITLESWNQPVLSNKGKVSCSRKQRGPLMGLEPTTSTLRVGHAIHCATPPHGFDKKLSQNWHVSCWLKLKILFCFSFLINFFYNCGWDTSSLLPVIAGLKIYIFKHLFNSRLFYILPQMLNTNDI